jgi:hypothetical protein
MAWAVARLMDGLVSLSLISVGVVGTGLGEGLALGLATGLPTTLKLGLAGLGLGERDGLQVITRGSGGALSLLAGNDGNTTCLYARRGAELGHMWLGCMQQAAHSTDSQPSAFAQVLLRTPHISMKHEHAFRDMLPLFS